MSFAVLYFSPNPNDCLLAGCAGEASLRKGVSWNCGCACRNDVFGARDAGCFAWLYGLDVLSMEELADRVLWGSEDDDMLRAIAQ